MERTESLLGVEDVAAQGVEVLDVANVDKFVHSVSSEEVAAH